MDFALSDVSFGRRKSFHLIEGQHDSYVIVCSELSGFDAFKTIFVEN